MSIGIRAKNCYRKEMEQKIRGRVIDLRKDQVTMKNESGQFEVPCMNPEVKLGDIVEASPNFVRILTPNRTPGHNLRFTHHVLDPRRIRSIEMRNQVERGIREFF